MIKADARRALADALGDHIEFDVSMARHSALRIGGPADAMITPRDRAELERALAICHAHGVPTRTLGSGFNVLVSDRGLSGAVLRLKKMRSIERTSKDSILVEAGASHATITRYCVEHGLSGLEFGAGCRAVQHDAAGTDHRAEAVGIVARVLVGATIVHTPVVTPD